MLERADCVVFFVGQVIGEFGTDHCQYIKEVERRDIESVGGGRKCRVAIVYSNGEKKRSKTKAWSRSPEVTKGFVL